jgi:hypothetical protein
MRVKQSQEKISKRLLENNSDHKVKISFLNVYTKYNKGKAKITIRLT